MLSRTDIEKELGKGISIVPLIPENIKENSINLTASNLAWCMSDFEFDEKYEDDNKQQIRLQKGKTAVFTINGYNTIIIPPYSTTLIETEEVLGLDGRIGGTYHSKVGIVSQGIGHIGTMLGPGFCGHSLIAIHNVSSEIFKIKAGETFVSIAFNYLKTPVEPKNHTNSGHIDKMSELGIILTRENREFIDADWKKNLSSIREKLNKEDKFKEFKIDLKNRKSGIVQKFIKNNNKAILIVFLIAIILFLICAYIDNNFTNANFVNEYWNILRIVIVVPVINGILKCMIKSN